MSFTADGPPDAPYGYCRGCGNEIPHARVLYPGWHDSCAADSGLTAPLWAPGEALLKEIRHQRQARRVDTTPRLNDRPIRDVELPSTQGLPETPHEEQSYRRALRSVRLVMELGDSCYFCGEHLTPQTITREHLTPTSRGGGNSPENTVAACWRCNTSKGDMTEAEFVAWIRRVSAVLDRRG